MSDYIKRDDTLKAMDTWDKFGCDGHGRLVPYTEEYVPYVKFDDMMKAVEGQPSADVAPVRHGHWIFNEEDMSLTCSDCGVKYNIDDVDGGLDFMENAKYCLSCGCKMDYDEWLASKDE